MREEIERYGGTVEKFIGDAVVGVFGVPVAHEDDPERAIRAALAMQARLGALNERLAEAAGGNLAMRIGLNTGEVLAVARGESHEGMVTGEAVNVAARLQSIAEPGAVVVGDRTYRDVRERFGFEPLGETSLKGLGRSVSAWRVTADTPASTSSRWTGPMVGRSEELGLLSLMYRRSVAEQRPNMVTVLGAPGIGKSRLAHEFAAQVAGGADGGAVTLRGRCLPYGDGLTYWPLAEMLKSQAAILDTDDATAVLSKARSHLREVVTDDELTPGMEDVLLSSIGMSTGTDPLAGTDSSAAHQLILGAWRRYFEGRAAASPLLAIFEDIHWADPSLLTLIESLAQRVRGPMLFLCLARPELTERRADWGSGVAAATRFGLSPLTENESASLIEHQLGEGAPEALVQLVLRRAEGNPFFAGEIIRMLSENGTLERREGRLRLAGPIPASLPDTVQGVIVSRIDLLDASQKRAIQDAAVVGRTFWHGALTLLGGHSSGTVDELIERGLAWERETSVIAGDRELMFSHGLIRDVAYGTIPRARRAEAHAALASWIEDKTQGRDEEFAELLAHHAEQAGDPARTARYAMLAGHRHRRVFAADEAIRWYDRALAAIDRLPPAPAALLAGETSLSRGEAHEQLGRFADARLDYEHALDVARQGGTERGWLEARALAAIVHVLWMDDRHDESLRLMPVALESARAAGQPDIEARLLYTQGTVALSSDRAPESVELHSAALRVAQEIGDVEGEALAQHGLAEARLIVGPLRSAREHADRADELLRRLGQRPVLHRNQAIAAWLEWVLGDLDRADALVLSALSGSREVMVRRTEGLALSILSLVTLSRGEEEAALQHARDSLGAARDANAARLELLARSALLVSLMETGDDAALRAEADTAQASASGPGPHTAPISAVGAWQTAMAGSPDEARGRFAALADAEHGIPDRLMSYWIEILCWERLADAPGLEAAGARMVDATSEEGGLFAAWGHYALAKAAQLRGDEAAAPQRADAARSAAVGAQLERRLADLPASNVRSETQA